MKKYRNYDDNDIIEGAKNVNSLAGLLKHLDLVVAGGNYIHLKKNLQRLNIDCSHWVGQAWNKDQQLKDWKDYKRVKNCKKHLILARGHKCEQCKLEQWLDEIISLEVHHVDGDRTNNEYDNLKLLCPNCHSFTNNYRGKKIKGGIII